MKVGARHTSAGDSIGRDRTSPRILDQAYINGHWCQMEDSSAIEILDSYSEQVIAKVFLASGSHVDTAVAAANAALPGWAGRPIAERASYVRAIADALAKQDEELAASITREVGMPLALSARVQVGAPIGAWRKFADSAMTYSFTSQIGHSKVFQMPVGVVACLTPWNYPLHQITAKVAPALLAGCTVVLKPSELAPSAVYALARAVIQAGLPDGVVNIVIGDGEGIGSRLIRHADVQMVSFTGSTAVGQLIAAQAAPQMKRLSMELGGKSASLVVEDADLNRAVKSTVASCMLNSGQTCNALTRLLVPRSRLASVREMLPKIVANYRMGDPFDDTTRLGPLVSSTHAQRVSIAIDRAVAGGAEILAGGPGTTLPQQGFFVPATILLADYKSEVAQEEIFGPVLCVIPYDDIDEAVTIANGTPYGLAAAVWAGTDEVALEIGLRMRCGQIDVNGASFNITAPFGGFGMSGFGRENGPIGISEFVEPVSIQMPT